MDRFGIDIKPQFVKLTGEMEFFPNGQECFLHEVQKRMKLDFEKFPEFTIITAPTGTGKSYAFPFPVINSKKHSKSFDEDKIRGLIVLPTNALIDEIYNNFSETYPVLKVKNITGKTLDEFAVKGFDRWLKVLELCKEADLVITNPDIINYAMHGGYHQSAWQNTGRKEFHNFLELFGYIIFDEYHLYDESQIANILTLIYLRDIFLNENSKIKYFFVSATPEKVLKTILQNKGYNVEEIVESIVENSTNARAIHGKIHVEFCNAINLDSIIKEYQLYIDKIINSGKRILFILDKLADVQNLSTKLSSTYPDCIVYQSTGYVSRIDNQQENIEKANIIVATNKAEVGVNYNVEHSIMQPGKYYQNLIQRFGRVARGNLSGNVIICFDNVTFNSLKKNFKDGDELSYYDFIERVQSVIQSKKFYEEKVPYYQGEYIWCIEKKLRRQYNSFKYFKERLIEEDFFRNKEAYSRYKLFSDIDNKIYNLKKIYPNGISVNAWNEWWTAYLNTFLYFRDSSFIVQIYDKSTDIELSYSLEWILQYKEILNIEEIEQNNQIIRRYIVGELKERDKDIQYQTNTIPGKDIGSIENQFLTPKDIFALPKTFENRIINIQNKKKTGVGKIDKLQIELLDTVKQLSKTFDRKRLNIIDIKGNDKFL
jgi:CRISPR-associated endonuclease/helicase Cas3